MSQFRQLVIELLAQATGEEGKTFQQPFHIRVLGGTTTILHEGRVIQSGKAAEVYHQPQTVLAAELFSEPPINLMPGRISGNEVSFANFVHFPLNV
ncbi:hypothetical protein Q6281_25985, partial [Klebsiella pneumoniae]|nr:hypothetical protein [Klebsiella pneumoniae]